MSRYAWLVTAVCGLALPAAPAFAKDPNQRADEIKTIPDRPEILVEALKQKVEFDGSKIGDAPLAEVLQSLAKKHNVTFVIMDEEFKAKKIEDIKDKKSRVKQLDTKGLTVAECLDAWLPGLGATYKIHADYVAVVPLLAKVQEPNPGVKLRKENPEPKPKKKADQSERILDTLALEFVLKDDLILNEIPLFELMLAFSKKYGVPVRINDESFKAEAQPNIREEKPKVAATDLRGMSVHQFLTTTLESVGATYLVKNGAIEIVPTRLAASMAKAALSENGDRPRLAEPLVSVIVKEKPLNEVVAQIAETYDLTVVILPQAADAKMAFVTARQLNLPADKALELLALQCDLRVVRRGTAFLLTSKDHANELFGEKMDRERQKIELEKLRAAPPRPPEPPPAPPAPGAPVPPAPKM